MKPLDEFIRENPERFDTEEPIQGHFDRFDKKLASIGARKGGRVGITILRLAAAVILSVVITHAAFREYRSLKNNLQKEITASAYPELEEAEQFYTTQVDQYYDKLQYLRFDNDKSEKKQIMTDLSEMDRQVRSMKKDLMQNPDDERIVSAIINFYQVKIELMDMIITRTLESTNI